MADYLALPEGDGRHPAVVVIHEWWGVNEQIKSIADRWAQEGFIAIVPDLFGGKVAKDSTEASAFMNALDFGGAVDKVASAVAQARQHPRSTGKVGVSGYCMGGALSFLVACSVPGLAAIVPFYGMPPGADWSKVDAPVMAHFALHDDWATVDGAKQIQSTLHKAGKKMDLHVYDAQHAFCNDRRPEVFNASACAQAWQRTVEFLRANAA